MYYYLGHHNTTNHKTRSKRLEVKSISALHLLRDDLKRNAFIVKVVKQQLDRCFDPEMLNDKKKDDK